MCMLPTLYWALDRTHMVSKWVPYGKTGNTYIGSMWATGMLVK